MKLKDLLFSLLFLLSSISGTDVVAMNAMNSDTDSDLDYNVPEIWEKRMRYDASRKSFWGVMKGGQSSEKPIIEKEDFVNQAGDVICKSVSFKNLANCWNILRAIVPTYGKARWIGLSAGQGMENYQWN